MNIGSSQELTRYIYEDLGLPVQILTANDNPSTSNRALRALVSQHPAVAAIVMQIQGHGKRCGEISKAASCGRRTRPTMLDPKTLAIWPGYFGHDLREWRTGVLMADELQSGLVWRILLPQRRKNAHAKIAGNTSSAVDDDRRRCRQHDG